MKITQKHSWQGSEIIILPFQKGQIDTNQIQKASGLAAKIPFEADFKEVKILYHPTQKTTVYLLGLGEEKHLSKIYTAARHLAHSQCKHWKKAITLVCDHLSESIAEQMILGLKLATYQMGRYKEEKKQAAFFSHDFSVEVVGSSEINKITKLGIATAETMIETMYLVDAPPNKKTPEYLANWAVSSAKEFGYKADILTVAELKKEGLGALLAVGQGSIFPPVLIKTEYKPAGSKSKTPKLGLVGKGITFDTGGLSIKGSQNLHYMKSDMGGAAAVLGAVELAAKLRLDIHVVGLVASAENAVDANSYRPGDVIGSYSGKTIEIIDTDAEGRLVLADALAYIKKNYSPEYIIDLATLTGSAVMSLGYSAGALFSNDDNLANVISKCGYTTDERVWRMPLFDDFETDLESDIADVRNFSGKPLAGAITAAKFLEYFVKDHPKWAHLDIAGVAFGDSEFSKMKSAKGYGPRLLLEVMKTLK